MKRKFLTMLLAFTLSVVCVFSTVFLASCSNGNNSDQGTTTSKQDASTGINSQNGGNGGNKHTHDLVHNDAVEPVCTRSGVREYWRCSSCDECFSDAEGKNSVKFTSLIIDPKGHTYSHYECTVCQEKLHETSGLEFELNSTQTAYIVTGFSYSSFTTELVIPETYNDLPVKEIGERAFYYDSSTAGSNSPLLTLNHLYLPDTLDVIGDYAFYGCEVLLDVNLGNSVTEIGEGAFEYCDLLQYIDIPDCVESIGQNAFYGDNALKSIVIGKNVSFIGMGAFDLRFTDNVKLETVEFKETTGWQLKSQNGRSWSDSTLDLTNNDNAIKFLRTTNRTNHLGRGN